MLNLIIFLRNLARFIEDRADGVKQSAFKKIEQEQANESKAFSAKINRQAATWDREVKRHHDNLVRIQSDTEQAELNHDSTVDAIETKRKQLELA